MEPIQSFSFSETVVSCKYRSISHFSCPPVLLINSISFPAVWQPGQSSVRFATRRVKRRPIVARRVRWRFQHILVARCASLPLFSLRARVFRVCAINMCSIQLSQVNNAQNRYRNGFIRWNRVSRRSRVCREISIATIRLPALVSGMKYGATDCLRFPFRHPEML